MPCSLVDRYQYLTGCLELQDEMGEEENMKIMLFTFSIHLLSNIFHFFIFKATFSHLVHSLYTKDVASCLVSSTSPLLSPVSCYHQPVHLYDVASELIAPTRALSNSASQHIPPITPLLNAASQLIGYYLPVHPQHYPSETTQ
jgi:hypothetical protein